MSAMGYRNIGFRFAALSQKTQNLRRLGKAS